uniref:Ig-like domain-containing protein n=1 Tax=Anabas testudineus TaxID=64144 RepID=A0A3Q1HIN5_ANATE
MYEEICEYLCYFLKFCIYLSTQVNIPAELGDTVNLTCQRPNSSFKLVEWSRPDLEPEYVFFLRNKQLITDEQHSSFKNRVELKDRGMKNGDVTLILKNVTTSDSGTYECRVTESQINRRKRANLSSDPICIINLKVSDSGELVCVSSSSQCIVPDEQAEGDGGKKNSLRRQQEETLRGTRLNREPILIWVITCCVGSRQSSITVNVFKLMWSPVS